MEKTKLDPDRRDALSLVTALWESLNWEKIPQRLRPRIYSIFQNWIQECAYTNTLQKFVNNFAESAICTTVPEPWIKRLNQILRSGRDRTILKVLREETAALIIYMRARRDTRKQAARQAFLEGKSDDERRRIEKYEQFKEKEKTKRR